MENLSCMSLGTTGQAESLKKLIKDAKEQNWTIIKVLEDTQKIYGFLPKSVIEYISKELNKPTSEIYSVATFYAEFSLSPKGKYPISVCMGTACYVNGAEAILNRIKDKLQIKEGETTTDGLFSIDETRCIGCCGMAPVMTIGEEVYGNVKESEVEAILTKYTEKN